MKAVDNDGDGDELQLFEAAGVLGSEAITGTGAGLDHAAGERVLAAAGHQHSHRDMINRLAWAITDRRTLISGYSNKSVAGDYSKHRYIIPHDELTGARYSSLLALKKLELKSASGSVEFPFGKLAEPVSAFYQKLLATPVPRREPPTPYPAPSESDPLGVHAAHQNLWFSDSAAAKMLALVHERASSGELPPAICVDLVRRIVLLNRMSGGPGVYGGAWLSPLYPTDFGEALCWALGAPANFQSDGQSSVLDFQIVQGRPPPMMNTTAALGLASYFVLGIGFSPMRMASRAIADAMLKKEKVSTLRVSYAPVDGGTSFALQANGPRPIEQIEPLFALALHRSLLSGSYRALSLRCQFGVERPLREIAGSS